MPRSFSMVAKISKWARYGLLILLVLLFLYISVKDISPGDKLQINIALRQADYRMILLGIMSLAASHVLRALRWQLLIKALGYRPSRTNVLLAVLAGYFANQALPRLGEFLKCSTLNRYERIPFDKLLGTVLLERLIDGLVLLLLLGLALGFQPGLQQALMELMQWKQGFQLLTTLGYLLLFIFLLFAVLLIGYHFGSARLRKAFLWIRRFVQRLWIGFNALHHLKNGGWFILYTALIWLMYGCCVYAGFLMFRETSGFGVLQVITILSAGSIGMILTPGGIGAYALLVQQTLMLYQLSAGLSLVIGWLLWLLQTALILVAGSCSLLLLPWYNDRRRRKAPSPD